MSAKHTAVEHIGGSGWWNLMPSEYARGLRFRADQSEKSASHFRAQNKEFSGYEVRRYERQASRLRAMALLCDTATVKTAGEVDFLGMTNPSQSEEDEKRSIRAAIAKATGDA